MNRDELQEKAWQAWLSAPSARHGVNAAVEVAEPIIRADEREQDRQRVSIQMIRQDAVDGALADLRAKVLGLPGNLTADFDGDPDVLLWRSDVLALLPEDGSDD